MTVFETLYTAIMGGAAALVIALLYDACSDRGLLDDKPEHDCGWDPADVERAADRRRDQVWGQP